MGDIVTVKDIQYLNFNEQKTFDLLLKLNINNSNNEDYIQGIVSLNSIGDLLTVKESILFIGDIPKTSENSFFCILNNIPLLYNYLNMNSSDIINYTLNVKLISPNTASSNFPIKISLNESIKLNLKHKNFFNFNNQKLDAITYQDSFKCFNAEEYQEHICKTSAKPFTKVEIKNKLLGILNNAPSCNTTHELSNTNNNKVKKFNIKTNKQNLGISLNKSTYVLDPNLKNIFVSIKFDKEHQVSAVSAQVFKYYNLSNFQSKIKVSPRIEKFTLFSDESLNMRIPLFEDEIIEPSVKNMLSYYLLIKFIEPEIANDSEYQYFDVQQQKNLLSHSLQSDIEGNLGLCQIPLTVAYF